MDFFRVQKLFDAVWRAIADLQRRLNKLPTQFPPQRPGPTFYTGVITGIVDQTMSRYSATIRSAPINPTLLGWLSPANWGATSTTEIEVWNAPGCMLWSPPLKVGEVFHGVQIGWRDPSSGSSGASAPASSSGSSPAPPIPIIALNRSPGSLVGKIVCKGPRNQSDFTDNRQWVQVQDVTASCNQEGTPTYEDANDILDPCDGVTYIPFIVAAINIGNQVHGHHQQPGKTVLLTPIPAYAGGGDPNVIRYYCEYIDPDDNGQRCPPPSSSMPSSSPSSNASSAPSSSSPSSNPGSSGPPTPSSGSFSCDNPIIGVTDTATTITFHYCNGATQTINKCCEPASSGSPPPASSGTPPASSGTPASSGSIPSGGCPCDPDSMSGLYPVLTGTETDATGTNTRTFTAIGGNVWTAPNDRLEYDATHCKFVWSNTGSTFRAERNSGTGCDPRGTYTVTAEDGNAPHTAVSVS